MKNGVFICLIYLNDRMFEWFRHLNIGKFECLDNWMHRCWSFGMIGYLNIWKFDFLDIWMFEYMNGSIFEGLKLCKTLLVMTARLLYLIQVIPPNSKFFPTNSRDLRASTVRLWNVTDLLKMRYSTNTVGEQPTGTEKIACRFVRRFFHTIIEWFYRKQNFPQRTPIDCLDISMFE